MLKRTPQLGLLIAAVMSLLTIAIFEDPERPFTLCQGVLLYFIAFFPSTGIAMLFDPISKKAKVDYAKVNFYEESIKETTKED